MYKRQGTLNTNAMTAPIINGITSPARYDIESRIPVTLLRARYITISTAPIVIPLTTRCV